MSRKSSTISVDRKNTLERVQALPMPGRIRLAMRQRGMSMRRLSEEAGIPYGTLQSYLYGRHVTPAPAIGSMAKVLRVTADWLIHGEASLSISALYGALKLAEQMEEFTEREWSRNDRAGFIAGFYEMEFLSDLGIEVGEGDDENERD